MKNRFAACLSAAVLTIGVYCLCSPYPCSIHAGEETRGLETSIIQTPEAQMASVDSGIFYMESDTDHAEEIRAAARSCVDALGDRAAVINDGTGCRVDTGFTGDYETAREVYLASKDEYYGNTGYSMDYTRLPDGDVRLILKTEYGTPEQAYREHLEAKARLTEIASSFSGTDGEKAEQIFRWACSHVSYADDATLERIQGTKPGCVPDYNGICATTYTAVTEGVSTCDGFSGMLLALFDLNGIPAAKVQNGQHAYNVALSGSRWMLYDAASGVCGNPEEFIRRYGDYYTPRQLTCGYGAETIHCGTGQTEADVCMGQKKTLFAP